MAEGVWIEGPRLHLRDFVADDWQAVHAYAQLPRVVQYLPWGPNTPQQSREFVARAVADCLAKPRQRFDLAAALKDGGALVGGGRVGVVSEPTGEGSVGCVLHPDHWGRGLGAEIIVLLLRMGFEQLALRRIFARCDTRNVASARVLEKVGLRYEGCLRGLEMVQGAYRDYSLYAVLRDEWRPAALLPPTSDADIDNAWIR